MQWQSRVSGIVNCFQTWCCKIDFSVLPTSPDFVSQYAYTLALKTAVTTFVPFLLCVNA